MDSAFLRWRRASQWRTAEVFLFIQIRKMIGLAVAVSRRVVHKEAYFPNQVFLRNAFIVVRRGLLLALVSTLNFLGILMEKTAHIF